MSKDKFKYEVLEENTEDVMQTKMVKRNVDVEFTMQELYDQEARWDGAIREIEGKLAIERATMVNVEEHHADAVALVSQLDPLKQTALLLWLRAFATVTELEPKLKVFKDAFDEHNEEVKDIIKQTGWVAPAVHLTVGANDNNKEEEAGEDSEG